MEILRNVVKGSISTFGCIKMQLKKGEIREAAKTLLLLVAVVATSPYFIIKMKK